ncbi:hypothetical protein PN498_17740 [Oscillatoria sp. CS-180]|uniref:hypothetical protein n=1 Tax=Oscillatoria sp. CS-180 TaxID=3021720 RepID=UPI00232A87BC|nr:hypothetical protein [Oscillatoria sp. CS-180]MDB9527842.1 hypothetical protein [Oscillatoria sp. CS-180]
MTTTLTQPQSTQALDLETTLQDLCDRYGLGAVGNALTRKYGRTQEIAACLGQLPDSTASTVPVIPANTR